LLDSTVGSENTSDFMAAARCVGYKGQFLIITETASVKESATALKVGATGIFSKSEAPDRLIQAIRLVAAGAVWVDRKILQLLLDQCPDPHDRAGNPKFSRLLEDREEKVIQGILGGHTTKRIGNNLDLSESAVRNILQRLFAKTGVRKRSQLVKLALEGSLGTSFAGAKTAGAAAAPADR
jgi:DNA-binding NarL/FixJ family response regulator